MANVNGNNTALMNKAQAAAGNTSATAPTIKPNKTINDFIKEMVPSISKAVPKHVSPDRVARIALTAIKINPQLLECERDSLLAGIMTGAQLGVELNTPLGQAYLIPRKKSIKMPNGQWHKIMLAQFQLGYQGIIDLAYRSGSYLDLYCEEVYSNDSFYYKLGLKRDLEHRPCEDADRGELTHIYAVYHTKNGGFDFQVWPVSKITAHAKKYSDLWNADKGEWVGGDKCAWVNNFIGMAKKTVLKALLKYAPKSIEFAKELETDEKIKKEIAPDMFEVLALMDENQPAALLEGPAKADETEGAAEPQTSEPETNEWTNERIEALLAKSHPLKTIIMVKRLAPADFTPIIIKHDGDLRKIVDEIDGMKQKPAPENKPKAAATAQTETTETTGEKAPF